MEVLEMLERLPAIADAIQRSRSDDRVRLRMWPPHTRTT